MLFPLRLFCEKKDAMNVAMELCDFWHVLVVLAKTKKPEII